MLKAWGHERQSKAHYRRLAIKFVCISASVRNNKSNKYNSISGVLIIVIVTLIYRQP